MVAQILDLTRIIDEHLPIYREGNYTDPAFEMETWCTVQSQGYRVSRVTLGTQTGTHIDAPAHFIADGANLDALPVQALMGSYGWVDLDQIQHQAVADIVSAYQQAPILFITASSQRETVIIPETLEALLALPSQVWVVAFEVQVADREALYFHQVLAAAGKYLIEDIDQIAARQVKPGGELIALPLRLGGDASGAPCRVVVRQK